MYFFFLTFILFSWIQRQTLSQLIGLICGIEQLDKQFIVVIITFK